MFPSGGGAGAPPGPRAPARRHASRSPCLLPACIQITRWCERQSIRHGLAPFPWGEGPDPSPGLAVPGALGRLGEAVVDLLGQVLQDLVYLPRILAVEDRVHR